MTLLGLTGARAACCAVGATAPPVPLSCAVSMFRVSQAPQHFEAVDAGSPRREEFAQAGGEREIVLHYKNAHAAPPLTESRPDCAKPAFEELVL